MSLARDDDLLLALAVGRRAILRSRGPHGQTECHAAKGGRTYPSDHVRLFPLLSARLCMRAERCNACFLQIVPGCKLSPEFSVEVGIGGGFLRRRRRVGIVQQTGK